MEQSTSRSSHFQSYLPNFFCDYEQDIANILLSIPNLIHDCEFRSKFVHKWVVPKRNRSAINLRPLRSLGHGKIVVERGERRPKSKANASSPNTPLDFSPSESSDWKPKEFPGKISKKKWRRAKLLQTISELIQRREVLRREIEAVKSYKNKLMTFNLELKAMKQEVTRVGVKIKKMILKVIPKSIISRPLWIRWCMAHKQARILFNTWAHLVIL